jgi:hypothetical protein
LQHSEERLWRGKLLGCEKKLESTAKTWIIVKTLIVYNSIIDKYMMALKPQTKGEVVNI